MFEKRKSLLLSESCCDQLTWKLWLLSNYQYETVSMVPIKRIVDHSTCEEKNSPAGMRLSGEVLGRLVKDIWEGKVMTVRRGSRGNVERYYMNLTRKGNKTENHQLPEGWSCIVESDKRMTLVRLENFLMNKQRATTELIMDDLNEEICRCKVRANGVQRDLESDLGFAFQSTFNSMNPEQRMVTIVTLVDKSVLRKGYKLASDEEATTNLPHLSANEREEKRVFSQGCLIFSNSDAGRQCTSCKYVMKVDRKKKMRKETRGDVINPKCNRKWLAKEDIERQLDYQRKEQRKALEREKYWKDKFISQSIELEEEDHHDLTSIFEGTAKEYVPKEMKCLWDQQQKIIHTASPDGYRWHPK